VRGAEVYPPQQADRDRHTSFTLILYFYFIDLNFSRHCRELAWRKGHGNFFVATLALANGVARSYESSFLLRREVYFGIGLTF
jgi:hypothetical protein